MIAYRTVVPLGLLGVVAGALFVAQQSRSRAFDPSTDTAAVCSSQSPYSAEAALGEPTHRMAVAVPIENPLPGIGVAPTYALGKGDVIQVEVSTARPGAVAVHGIMEAHRVRVGATASVKLRAKYTGRYPLHFHGDDGSHIAVAVLEVR